MTARLTSTLSLALLVAASSAAQTPPGLLDFFAERSIPVTQVAPEGDVMVVQYDLVEQSDPSRLPRDLLVIFGRVARSAPQARTMRVHCVAFGSLVYRYELATADVAAFAAGRMDSKELLRRLRLTGGEGAPGPPPTLRDIVRHQDTAVVTLELPPPLDSDAFNILIESALRRAILEVPSATRIRVDCRSGGDLLFVHELPARTVAAWAAGSLDTSDLLASARVSYGEPTADGPSAGEPAGHEPTPGNTMPVAGFEMVPPRTEVGKPVAFLSVCSDADGDTLQRTWFVNGHHHEELDGLSEWQIDDPPEGLHTVRLVIEDGRGGRDELSKRLLIVEEGDPNEFLLFYPEGQDPRDTDGDGQPDVVDPQ